MEQMLNVIVNNWKLFIVICSIVLLFLFVYELDGFFILLRKALGTALQKLCSLLIEAICLVFKIINSLEIYIVLLIDALTGKATANGKIASLAIGVLSVASFYTTYTGMTSFVAVKEVAFLITLGVQAILLSTSLQINENLEFREKKLPKRIMWVAVFLCIASCIIIYLLSLMQLSYRNQKIYNHILYLIAIVSVLITVVSLVRQLINSGMKKQNEGMFLLLIYFAVLCISSFFSYNAFVSAIYPDSVRNIDGFSAYKVEIIELMDHLDDMIDDEYYVNVKAELISELKDLQIELNNMNNVAEYTVEEKNLSEREQEFEGYIQLRNQLKQLNDELKEENDQWDKNFEAMLQNSGGIGPNTRKLIEEMEAKHEQRAQEIKQKIEDMQKSIEKFDSYIVANIIKYKEMKESQRIQNEKMNCSAELELITRMLKWDDWYLDEEGEIELRNAIDKIEDTRIHLQATGKITNSDLINNIYDMVEVYWGYKVFKEKFRQGFQKIQSVVPENANYMDAQDLIEKYAYEILQCIPATSYVFYSEKNQFLQTGNLGESSYYSSIELLKRNANSNISQIEKNIRTFLDNKMIGLLCAILALLIDMMILFVGIILPKGITFPNMSQKAYSEEDVKQILSNLFNKPVGR